MKGVHTTLTILLCSTVVCGETYRATINGDQVNIQRTGPLSVTEMMRAADIKAQQGVSPAIGFAKGFMDGLEQANQEEKINRITKALEDYSELKVSYNKLETFIEEFVEREKETSFFVGKYRYPNFEISRKQAEEMIAADRTGVLKRRYEVAAFNSAFHLQTDNSDLTLAVIEIARLHPEFKDIQGKQNKIPVTPIDK